ncbi:hypothetical protein ACIBHY_31420 [Nonomuraea sp. NPDC050547]|uniref:hypothetical protein n=1 Tax=unclassified Nonomuraea TaxID=2593643 RepID=UPI0037A36E4C
MPSPVDVVSAEIEDLLAVPVARLEELDGHPWVLRVHLADGCLVIVKRPRPDGYGLRSAAELMRCERAALELLEEDLGPRLLAAPPDTRMLVFEDLAPRTELSRLLRRDGLTPELDDRLTEFAVTQGEIAAASAGRAADFAARRTELGTPARDLGDGEHAWTGLWRTAPERAMEFGVPMPDAAERDLRAAGTELAEPGPFLVLTNGDPEAHNYLTLPDGDGRLIDFEGAGFRHALTAAAGFTVPGPQWMAVSGERQITAFRSALARGVPEAEDNRRFGYGLASAAAVWTAIRANDLRRREAREPGDDSRLQLVAGLEAGARTASEVFPHFAGWCRSTAEVLRRRWPDTDVDTAAIAPYTWRRRP